MSTSDVYMYTADIYIGIYVWVVLNIYDILYVPDILEVLHIS